MASYTPNINLKKPTASEMYNVLDWNNNSDKIDTAIGALSGQLSMKTTTIGSYANPNANAWGNTGLTIVVPTGHVIIGVLWTGYSSGKPLGIGVDENDSPTGGIPIQCAENANGQYGITVFLWPGTWHVFDKRAIAASSNNNFYLRYIDLG